MRVTKRAWYAKGGFRNTQCWRQQVRGAWRYYVNNDYS